MLYGRMLYGRMLYGCMQILAMILYLIIYQSWDACILIRFIFRFGQNLMSGGGYNSHWRKLKSKTVSGKNYPTRCSSFVTSAFHWLDNSLRFFPVMASVKFIWKNQTCKCLAACSNFLQRFLFYNSPNSNKYSLSWDVKISWSKTLKATSFLIWQELVQILGGDIFLVALFLFPV